MEEAVVMVVMEDHSEVAYGKKKDIEVVIVGIFFIKVQKHLRILANRGTT